jgi:hypothetical protein
MSFGKGFNTGFSVGLAGKVFNRGFSKKISSIQNIILEPPIAPPVEPPVEPPPALFPLITTTNYFVSSIQYNIYYIDFSNPINAGMYWTIITASPSSYIGQVVFTRVDSNATVTANIIENTGNQIFPVSINSSITLVSNGLSWSIFNTGTGGSDPGNTLGGGDPGGTLGDGGLLAP